MQQNAVIVEESDQGAGPTGRGLDAAGVKEAARGRWIEVLGALAPTLAAACGRVGKHVPCPIHGGKDGFRLFPDAAETGGGICASCGSRPDGFDILQWANGWTFPQTLQAVAGYLGIDGSPPAHGKAPAKRPASGDGIQRQRLEALWNTAGPDTGRIAEYLRHRGLSGRVPAPLRLHRALPYRDGESPVAKYPAILAPVQAVDGQMVSIHRTFLSATGAGKAPVPSPKKFSSPIFEGATKGAAVRLGEAGDTICIAEGIETGMSVQEATGIPTWAALSAGGVESIQVPTGVRRVEIWADNDINGTGQNAARKAAERLRAAGLEVHVFIPDQVDKDWLDVLVERGPEALRSMRTAPTPEKRVVDAGSSCLWEPPAPFFEHNLPSFPVQALPGWLRTFVEGVALSTQTPPDLCGMVALSSLSAAVAGKVVVEVKEGYREPVNLFMVVDRPDLDAP